MTFCSRFLASLGFPVKRSSSLESSCSMKCGDTQAGVVTTATCTVQYSTVQYSTVQYSTVTRTSTWGEAAEVPRLRPGWRPPTWSCQPPPVVSSCSTTSTPCTNSDLCPQKYCVLSKIFMYFQNIFGTWCIF